jgi:hypothetical protein
MLTEKEQQRFEMHRDGLIRLFAKVVVDWAEETERDQQQDAIPFMLAVEWAYMVGAVVTAKANIQSERQIIDLARIVWKEYGRPDA